MHCCPAAQVLPQSPQFSVSRATLTHRQLRWLWLGQKRFPAAQKTQTALSQCCDSGHAWLHRPQCRSFSYRVTHEPLHALFGGLQLSTQAPA